MEKGKNCRKMFVVGAALMISIIMLAGPVFAVEDVILPDEIAFGEVEVGQVKTAELVISHTANSQVVAAISFSSTCPDLSLGATSLTIPAGQTGSVIVTYSPSEAGPCTGTMELQFTWIQPFGSVDLGTKTVTVTGTGLAPKESEPQAVDIESILEFFDASVAAKAIKGKGKGRHHAAERRLEALRRMLEMADEEIQNGRLEQACRLLNVVYKKIDGEHRPLSAADFAIGEALPQMADMVAQVMEDLACPGSEGLHRGHWEKEKDRIHASGKGKKH